MSVIVFTPSLSKRKELLKIITHAHKQWKFRIALAVFLFVLSAAVIVGTAILLLMNPTTIEGILAFSGAGICFSSIPFFIALSVKNTAKYKCGFPYSSYANASLLLNDDSLEYVFWRVGPHEPAAYSSTRAVYRDEDKFTFTINKSDIASLCVRNEICYIKGDGILQMPECAVANNITTENCKEFSFIPAFPENNFSKRIKDWRSYNVRTED